MPTNETVFRDVYGKMAGATTNSSTRSMDSSSALQILSKLIGIILHPLVEYLAKVDLTQWDVIVVDY